MDKSADIKKIPFILITGFLGSGKTSLLKEILKTIGSESKIAIIQNEFAPGKSDSVELQNTDKNFDLLEVNNGSVFCACQLDNFVSRLDDFLETFAPEIIFLEATGLADPISMGQILQSPGVSEKIYLAGIWTVVDAINFAKSLKYVQRVQHQIQLADLIIINKTDLLEGEIKIHPQIKEWNHSAPVELAEFGSFNNLNKHLKTLFLPDKGIGSNGLLSKNEEGSPRPDIGSCVIRTQKIISEDIIRQFWSQNKEKIFRMKGFIRVSKEEYIMVQSIFDQIEIKKVDFWSGSSEMIVMGPGIQARWVMNELIP